MSKLLSPLAALKLSDEEKDQLNKIVGKVNEQLISRARGGEEVNFDIPHNTPKAVVLALIHDLKESGWHNVGCDEGDHEFLTISF